MRSADRRLSQAVGYTVCGSPVTYLDARPEESLHAANDAVGTLFLRAGRHDLAVEPLRVAWRLFPGYSDAGNNLAVALVGIGKRQEAIVVLEEIVKYWPHERAMANLAKIRAGAISKEGLK